MSASGYFVHPTDMNLWLNQAQKALVVKNKVRKELWSELMEIIRWDPVPYDERLSYFRIPQTSFVSLQTFCLTDGKGADTVSNDQLLNYCTTVADLRSRLALSHVDSSATLVRSQSVVSFRDDDDEKPPMTGSVVKTVVTTSPPKEEHGVGRAATE